MSDSELPNALRALPLPTTTPAKKYGMGHRPTPRSDSDLNATARLGAPRGLPGEVSLQSFVRRVNNQGQTESCVGQALTKGIDTRLRKMGLNVPEPSAQACYTLAREEETPKGQPLEDNGSIAGDAFKAMKNLGCPREMVWPLNPAVINERLSWDVLQDASRFLVLDPYRMNEEGASRSDAIANALTQGFPVVFAQQIDNKFFDYTGGTIQLFDPDVAGGHMMCIMGFRPSPGAAGGREFLVINSWGEDWGEGGYCWMHERILADPRSDEFYVVDVAA